MEPIKVEEIGARRGSNRYRTRDAAGTIGIIFFILGFVLIFTVIIFANPIMWAMNVVYVLVLGVIFAVTGLVIFEATKSSKSHRISDASAYFAARGGSARAKRKITRGHRYSSRKRR
jgi:type IV secretory pathway VirB3-like protein